MVVVDPQFKEAMANACKNLNTDGFYIEINKDMATSDPSSVILAASTPIGKAIEIVQKTLHKNKHALYRGEIYRKAEKGNFYICTLSFVIAMNF